MSSKANDRHGRWRSMTIAFRISPEDNEQINKMVALAGITKQQYITDNMLRHQIVIIPTPRVHKALKEYFVAVAEQLERIGAASELDDEFLAVLKLALQIYDGMQSETD